MDDSKYVLRTGLTADLFSDLPQNGVSMPQDAFWILKVEYHTKKKRHWVPGALIPLTQIIELTDHWVTSSPPFPLKGISVFGF